MSSIISLVQFLERWRYRVLFNISKLAVFKATPMTFEISIFADSRKKNIPSQMKKILLWSCGKIFFIPTSKNPLQIQKVRFLIPNISRTSEGLLFQFFKSLLCRNSHVQSIVSKFLKHFNCYGWKSRLQKKVVCESRLCARLDELTRASKGIHHPPVGSSGSGRTMPASARSKKNSPQKL